jgi:hypothetical protein
MYEQKISREKPGLIGLVLDDSLSMADNLPGTSDPKYKWVERYFGIILEELLSRSTEVRGTETMIKPRYYVYVLKYGSRPELWGKPEMDVKEAVELFSNSGNSLGLGGHLQGTDAEKALREMYEYLKQALAGERFRNSFPPLCLHLTDGESQTDATQAAEKIKQLSTNDGNVLMSNAYIGTQTSLSCKGPEDFPGYLDASEAGPTEYNIRLFNMSSQAPECILANLKADNFFPKLRAGCRLFFDVRTKEMLKNAIAAVGSMGSRMAR